ncbi:hypothetical protein [Noviherbaspirillum aridicola]|uniref:Bacteriocin resistance YdeI/OmpD-like protein n=1 Tax=Noviherbaspirillum aridicola TaxID=2849687 RepID=A0ABQ4QA27_9BURK|nr:hypothetical protein [Noviherbaspirillum aridicola]GIZ54063.1 hypothetical protein NCCP691_40770 [Noviherbaspirillum aridicola]
MFDSPEIQGLLEEIRNAGENDLIKVGTLAQFVARASGEQGTALGFVAVPILNKMLAMDGMGDVKFLHPKTLIPYDRHDWDELSDEWLVYRDVAIEIVERLYQRRGQMPLPLPEAPRRPPSTQQLQETAILDWLKADGRDLHCLEKWSHNRPGAKKDARDAMRKNINLFQSDKVFDLAWERLRAADAIRYEGE